MTACAASLSTVLLVEDDKVTNMMHMRLIKRSGLIRNVDIATDGLAALEYLQARRDAGLPAPELILLDINMPRMDGFEFLQDFAAVSAAYVPVRPMIIMLSTSVLRADQERAAADPHVYRFMGKPMGTDDIGTFVREYQEFAAI